MELFVQSKVRPEHNMSKAEAIPEKQTVDQQPRRQEGAEEKEKESAAKPNREAGVVPAIITTLLLVPLLLVISVGLFICWRRNSMYDNKTLASALIWLGLREKSTFFQVGVKAIITCPYVNQSIHCWHCIKHTIQKEYYRQQDCRGTLTTTSLICCCLFFDSVVPLLTLLCNIHIPVTG